MGKIVKTLQGAVEGTVGTDLNGNPFHKFLGIPYAKPPVGDLRFKDPQPADSWPGVRNATSEGSACFHRSDFTQQIEGSEDCLYLNVFTRDLPDESEYLKPVMVWIHGGAFLTGSSSQLLFGAEFLVSEDVVLVTLNYRLGLLGFLRIKEPSFNITGNMGFRDQIEALRWVKGNIQQFNGDPDNVTIFGESAGAASVHYHVLSPLSRDLFHKAILQSGTALNCWSDECDHNAVQIARIHDSNVSTQKEALEVLKRLSVEELYKVQTTFLSNIAPGAIRPIGLVIEPPSKKVAFMSKRPIDIITSGEYNKVPLIFGYNNREGILFNELRKQQGARKLQAEHFIPHNVNLKKSEALKRNYVDKINNLYFSGPDEDDNNILMMSDAWFVAGIHGSVKNHAQTSAYPVYLYKLSLDTQLNIIKTVLKTPHIFGCSHADDLGYLFKTLVTPPIIEPGSIEDVSLKRILKLWTNFARYGNPTPDVAEFGLIWKPVMARQINALHIREQLSLEVNPDSNRIDLWREIYRQGTTTVKYL